MTEYVMAHDIRAAMIKFEEGCGEPSLRAAVQRTFGDKLFKCVRTPGKTVWYAHTNGEIPAGATVRWDAVTRADALPVHNTVRHLNPDFLHKTPDTLTFPIRYPVIGREGQSTRKVTELK